MTILTGLIAAVIAGVMPLVWVIGPAGVLGCVYLFTSLSAKTMIFFAVWNVIGVVVYLAYGRVKSRLA